MLNRKLSQLAAQQHSDIHCSDYWSNSVIGMDDHNGKVFFYRQNGQVEVTRFIQLEEMQNCRVQHQSHHVGKNGSQRTVIDRVELVFSPAGKGKSEIALEFFDAETDVQLDREVVLAEKWAKLIKEKL